MNISSQSLFHFTPKFEYLESIVENGFQFRECHELLPLSGYKSCIFDQLGIVQHIHYPLIICFCDLPLSASNEHRKQYGEYAIAMTKEWGMKNEVTPIRYVHAHSPDFISETYNLILDIPGYLRQHNDNLFEFLSQVLNEKGDDDSLTKEDLDSLSPGVKKLLAFANGEYLNLLSHWHRVMQYVRAYDGDWTDRSTGQKTHRTFYNEREWRAASYAEGDWIQFKFADIRHLIVTTEDEKKALAEQFLASVDDFEITDPTQVWSKIRLGSELYSDL